MREREREEQATQIETLLTTRSCRAHEHIIPEVHSLSMTAREPAVEMSRVLPQVTDEGMEVLAGMTSLVSLQLRGCHRLTPRGRNVVSHLLDRLMAY